MRKPYVAWLSARTNQQYRLLSESEWEYVARAGATSAYPWGADANAGCSFANGVDRAVGMRLYDHRMVCDDGAADATPVGSYSANAFGLYDTIGNVFEWVEDCYAVTLSSTPTDGRPADGATCARRIARGGSWDHFPRYLRSAFRKADAPTYRTNHLGFRVARALQ